MSRTAQAGAQNEKLIFGKLGGLVNKNPVVFLSLIFNIVADAVMAEFNCRVIFGKNIRSVPLYLASCGGMTVRMGLIMDILSSGYCLRTIKVWIPR